MMDDVKFMWLKKLCLGPSGGKLPPDEQREPSSTPMITLKSSATQLQKTKPQSKSPLGLIKFAGLHQSRPSPRHNKGAAALLLGNLFITRRVFFCAVVFPHQFFTM